MKDIYMSLLLVLHEDFDDDRLLDAMDIVASEWFLETHEYYYQKLTW